MGSTPTSATFDTIPWSNGDDAWLTSRKGRFDSVRDHLVGSVGVSGATALVRRKAGFNSRTDLLKNEKWACMPLEAIDPCMVDGVGSTPIRSTETKALGFKASALC